MDVNALKEALRSGIATVEFTKVNGLKRVMLATLETSHLPKVEVEGKTNRPLNDSTLVVFDVEHQGWRTIKIESIISWFPGDVKPVEVTAPETPKVIGTWSPATPTPTP